MKMKERNKEEKKRRALNNNFIDRIDRLRRYQRNGWMELSERRDIDSLDIEGTYTLVMGRYRAEGMVYRAWAHERAPLNTQWLILRIGDADFYHCWVVDSA